MDRKKRSTQHVVGSESLLKRYRQRSLAQKIESPLSPSFCRLVWNHDEHQETGHISEVTLKLIRESGAAYLLKPSDQFGCSVIHVSSDTTVAHTVQPAPPLVGQSEVRVAFTAQKLGRYRVEMSINGRGVGGGPTHRTFIPGPLDVAQTQLAAIPSPKIVTKGVYFTIKLFPRDSHGSPTTPSEKLCHIDIKKHGVNGGESIKKEPVTIRKASTEGGYELCLKLKETGYFVGTVKYDGKVVGQPCFTIICLTSSESRFVRTTVLSRERVCYKAMMQTTGGELTRVQCFITPQALEVRKSKLTWLTQMVYTCPISPTRKITLHKEDGAFSVNNGSEDPIQLFSKDRTVIAATFSKVALHNMGGSECFWKKKLHFYDQLKMSLYHTTDIQREILPLLIDRQDVLNSAIKATKKFSLADWKKKFAVEFAREEALDYGGPSREFVELLSQELFNGEHSCFIRLDEDNQQAPVHPNPAHTCYQHHEFAGKLVGKCLVECALENILLLKVKFTRSFLAQLIALKVDYSYYENDDPAYFQNKIQYTLTEDITDAELFYTDSADDSVALVRDGVRRRVTQENKQDYLNQLALYRLAKKPSKQVKHFFKGLMEIVPRNLLLMFTVSELELLLCGTCEVTYEDMKAHTQVEGDTTDCSTLDWFWSIVKDFTPDERAVLLKFVTGSSVLPQGGFKNLSPPFAISVTSPQKGRLPSAHTCINQFYVPQCESKEELHISLMRAFKEGGNVFLLC